MIKYLLSALLLSGCSFDVNLDAVKIANVESIYISIDVKTESVDTKLCEKLGLRTYSISYVASKNIATVICVDWG